MEQARIIRWENPPPSLRDGAGRKRSDRFSDVAAELRAHPGRWAVIEEAAERKQSALANHIRQGAILAFAPAGDFDAVSRRVGGSNRVYACFLGDEVSR